MYTFLLKKKDTAHRNPCASKAHHSRQRTSSVRVRSLKKRTAPQLVQVRVATVLLEHFRSRTIFIYEKQHFFARPMFTVYRKYILAIVPLRPKI